jgi:hypothetical protein
MVGTLKTLLVPSPASGSPRAEAGRALATDVVYLVLRVTPTPRACSRKAFEAPPVVAHCDGARQAPFHPSDLDVLASWLVRRAQKFHASRGKDCPFSQVATAVVSAGSSIATTGGIGEVRP